MVFLKNGEIAIKLKTPKSLLAIIAIFILITTTILLSTWFRIVECYSTEEYRLKNVQDAEWMFIKAFLDENYDKAQMSAEQVKHRIVEDVEREYGNDVARLQFDLDHPSGNKALYQIIHRDIQGVYINKNTDSNDPFVFTSFGIIGDLSLDCSPSSTEVTFRTWEQEFAQQSNPVLARIAVQSMLKQTKKPVFWEFLKSDSAKHPLITAMELGELETVFRTEGMAGLKTYEFLSYVVMFNDEDLVGRKLRLALGTTSADARLVYIVQGFNLIDALEHNKAIAGINSDVVRKMIKDQIANQIKHEVLTCIGLLLIVLSTLVGLLIAQTVEEETLLPEEELEAGDEEKNV